MSKFQLYGSNRSRASRAHQATRELGVPFEQLEIPFEQMKAADYLAINPNGKVPGFVEGDLKLFESLAINLYLAKKFGTGELYPTNLEDEARVLQWTLWAATEVEPKILPVLLFKLGFSKDEAAAKSGPETVKQPLKVLDQTLATRDWLVGNKFSVADLNVAAVVGIAPASDIDISYVPHVEAWLARINARPARNA
jgi:glutathione S-transferase